MAGKKLTDTPSIRATVAVRVAPDAAPRLAVGSRWRVVELSLDSLWQGRTSVILEAIEETR